MLESIFRELDEAAAEENIRRIKEEGSSLPSSQFYIFGQLAVIEAKLSFSVSATHDLDAKTNAEYWVRKQLDQILKTRGLIWDPDSDKVWMPEETEYKPLFEGEKVTAFLANIEYVMLSKACKALKKNKNLLVQYIAHGAAKKFLDLCVKYHVNLKELSKT